MITSTNYCFFLLYTSIDSVFSRALTGDYRRLIRKIEVNQVREKLTGIVIGEEAMDIPPVRFIMPYYNLLRYFQKKKKKCLQFEYRLNKKKIKKKRKKH